MNKGLFITGTDTECGKTEITLGIMCRLQQGGSRVLGMKPVASGGEMTCDGLRNEDGVRIQRQGSVPVPYELINPFVYGPPVAPHLAAAEAGERIDLERIAGCFEQLSNRAELMVVEGVGGWQVPLNDRETVADMARRLSLPVILVVGMKLGCINHALLTVESIAAAGVNLAGWVANLADPGMLLQEANIETLRQRIEAPLLGVVPRLQLPDPESVASRLDLSPLTG